MGLLGETVPKLNADLEDLIIVEFGKLNQILERQTNGLDHMQTFLRVLVDHRLDPLQVHVEKRGEKNGGHQADFLELLQVLGLRAQPLPFDGQVAVRGDDLSKFANKVLKHKEEFILNVHQIVLAYLVNLDRNNLIRSLLRSGISWTGCRRGPI